MTRFTGSTDYQGAEFLDVDMSDAVFREVDLSRVRMYGVSLNGADIDGDIEGLRLNGVEVAPLVEAELDRLHPERTLLRPTTVDGMRTAWQVVERMWEPTMRRAEALPEALRQESVNGEWSFADTLRHLVFVTDAWLGNAVLGDPQAFHPLGLPASFITDAGSFGIDVSAKPSYDEVVAARLSRMAMVKSFVDSASQEELDLVREVGGAPGWPPARARTAVYCLHVIFNEEWTHHQFAVRDLTIVETSRI